MAVSEDYIAYVVDQLSGLTRPLRTRRMFGGVGIYCGELFFAILMDDELYLKVDDDSRADYECLRLKPFTYDKKGRAVSLDYYPVPAEVLEDRDRLNAWAGRALEAARGAGSRRR